MSGSSHKATKMRDLLRRPARQRGQSLAEMAVVIPVLVFLLMGGFDASVMISDKITAGYAVRHFPQQHAAHRLRGHEGGPITHMKTRYQRPKQSAGVLRRLKKQGGQAIVLLALTGTLLIGGVGIAVDLAVGYMYSIAAERAAAAAALSGVVFMPDQFSSASAVPLGSRNDATDRAVDEAKRNGFDPANTQE